MVFWLLVVLPGAAVAAAAYCVIWCVVVAVCLFESFRGQHLSLDAQPLALYSTERHSPPAKPEVKVFSFDRVL